MTRPLPSWRARNRARAMPLLTWMAHEYNGPFTAQDISRNGGLPEWYAALLMDLLCRYGYLERTATFGAYAVTAAGRREVRG
ncbi:MAG: hypothetical protein M0Z66_16080 [Thermaerobacter sp.]|nr:hypothetical protein [Thermaerobacter sp.]